MTTTLHAFGDTIELNASNLHIAMIGSGAIATLALVTDDETTVASFTLAIQEFSIDDVDQYMDALIAEWKAWLSRHGFTTTEAASIEEANV